MFINAQKSLKAGIAIIVVSLAAGVSGYHFIEHQQWVDALLNASMILGGMGPVDVLKTTEGKIFASIYALYSGLVIIAITGLLLGPVFHRILSVFHESKK